MEKEFQTYVQEVGLNALGTKALLLLADHFVATHEMKPCNSHDSCMTMLGSKEEYIQGINSFVLKENEEETSMILYVPKLCNHSSCSMRSIQRCREL